MKKLIIIFLAFGLLILSLSFVWVTPDRLVSDTALANHPAQWAVAPQDSFVLSGENMASGVKKRSRQVMRSRHPDILLWESWNGNNEATGIIESASFPAPSLLRIYVSGYFDSQPADNQVLLQRLDTADRLKLHLQNPGDRWVPVDWRIPQAWRGKPVKLIAMDQSVGLGGWMGVSSPVQLSWFSLVRSQFQSMVVLPFIGLHLLLFVLPGSLLAIWWRNHFRTPDYFFWMLSITFSALLGYFAFMAYWANPSFGISFSIGSLSISLAVAIFLYSRKRHIWKTLNTSPEIRWPFLLWGLVACFYLAVLFIQSEPYEPASLMTYRFLGNPTVGGMAPDNVIPQIFADRLYRGKDLLAPIVGDWLASDRPPLQSGIILLQYPLRIRINFNTSYTYQVLGTILQCTWIPAVWALGRALRLSNQRIAIFLAFTTFSGFFLFNSLFPWPKLLGGALILFVFAIFYEAIRENRATTLSEITIIAIATALGLLSHGSVVFTLIPMFFVLFARPGNYQKWLKLSVVGGLLFFLLLSPWGAYQKFYNPPGNRLAKWYLAGATIPDSRSSLEAIRASYSQLTFPKFLDNKWENTKLVFTPVLGLDADTSRRNHFFRVFNSLGFLNLGWLLLLWPEFRQKLRQENLNQVVTLLLSVGLASVAVWIILVFGPGMTIIHTGSYATMTLLLMGLSTVVSVLPKHFVLGLIVLQLLHFTLTWIVTTPPIAPGFIGAVPNFWMIGLSIISALVIMQRLWHLGWSNLHSLATTNATAAAAKLS